VTDELLPYYERELTFIRQMAVEFSKKHPGVAGRLLLEPNTCEDPHVERLIEAFALLTGRIHRKLDDEFPEITESLLDVLYPHYLKPIPSFAIAQFRLSPGQSPVPEGTAIPAATPLHHVQDGQTCTFRSSYPVQLWPLRVTGASVSAANRFNASAATGDAAAVIRIGIECLAGVRLSQMPLQFLRFYLDGETAAVQALYELLFANTLRVTLRAVAPGATAQAILPDSALRPVGFSIAEGVLPYSDRSFAGYRLLQEYFSFPEKFLFFDLAGLERVALGEFGSAFEIVIALKETPVKHRLTALEQTIDANTFQLGCAPIVNLFERIAEPIRVSHTKSEYHIIPDQHRQASTEIYSVDRVSSLASYQEEPQVYQPLYSLNHGGKDAQKRFWYTHRRSSFRKNDNGTEVYLSLVDLDFKPALPAVDMLTVRVTCTNRDHASRLKLTGEFRELETEGIPLVEARCLRKPTPALRAPRRQSLQWRLISHLSLNHLSIVEKGRAALQEILRLYDFGDSAATRKQIEGIAALHSQPGVGRIVSPTGVAFCRGTDITIEFDENEYAGGGVFLLASVLQAFLGLYSAVNSFSRLTAKTSKGVLKRWPPLAGEQILL
jgi:type VI secretion system protein ImpG